MACGLLGSPLAAVGLPVAALRVTHDFVGLIWPDCDGQHI